MLRGMRGRRWVALRWQMAFMECDPSCTEVHKMCDARWPVGGRWTLTAQKGFTAVDSHGAIRVCSAPNRL